MRERLRAPREIRRSISVKLLVAVCDVPTAKQPATVAHETPGNVFDTDPLGLGLGVIASGASLFHVSLSVVFLAPGPACPTAVTIARVRTYRTAVPE